MLTDIRLALINYFYSHKSGYKGQKSWVVCCYKVCLKPILKSIMKPAVK